MNCKWIEILLAIVAIVFTLWPTAYSKWVVVIAAALILIHALSCKMCHTHHHRSMMHEAKSRKR